MLCKTKGIVFNALKYGDNKLISKVLTEDLGIKTFVIQCSKKNKSLRMLWQPFMLLEIVFDNKEKNTLQFIRETRIYEPTSDIYTNVFKSCMALFISEVLLKAIREEEQNISLYTYIQEFIIKLNAATHNYSDYHLIFLTHLSRFLGFPPKISTNDNACFFDMLDGRFVEHKPIHSYYIDKSDTMFFKKLIMCTDYDCDLLGFNRIIRNALLTHLLAYYKLHLEGMGEIKSLEILKSVFE